MISYSIELHDITDLTAPMWDACGIECPKMIGATCPEDAWVYGQPHCPGKSSKFPNAAAEVVHDWTLDSSQDEECGDTDRGGWFALFRTPDDERRDDNPMGAGVILCVISSGATQLTRFDSTEELTRDWAKITAEHEDEEDE